MLVGRAGATYTRVAVVQMAFHPAIVVGRRSPLEDPLFDLRKDDALAPAAGEVPAALAARLDALRRRIRETYDAQVLAKVGAVLAQCRAWQARVVVFPEYSIPWEILGGVADAAGDMVVVAGTHTVDQAAKKSGIYERLVTPVRPQVGQSVCPVLHRGRLLALQAKLNPASAERGSMRPGDAWAPVIMPDGIPGPMGVMVCLDFLFREGGQHQALVAEALAACRFLAVPSLTPAASLPEFAGKAWEEARRYGRPVLYCDGAEGGGTSVYVDEGQAYDLRRFPDRAGYLETGDEGVIVTDVDLGYERPGRSTRYAEARPVVPIAEATFVYRSHPVGLGYAGWLSDATPLLARDDDEALEAMAARVERDRDLLLNAGALSGAKARERRLRRLVSEIGKVTSVEELRQFTREIVMPPEAMPLGDLRAAMAGAAADVVFAWLKQREARAAGFSEVEERLRKAADVDRGSRSWTRDGVAALAAVAIAVRGPSEEKEEAPAVPEPVRVVLPAGIDPAALGTRRHDGWTLVFRPRPEDFRAAREDRGPGREREAGAHREGGVPQLPEPMVRAARDLVDLAHARGADRVATVVAVAAGQPNDAVVFVALFRGDCWLLWTTEPADRLLARSDALHAAFRASGLSDAILVPLGPRDVEQSIATLLPRFAGGRATAKALLAQRLAEVGGAFVEPDVQAAGEDRRPVLRMLDAWLVSGEQTALVLGEFGSGKSTALAAWACRVWERQKAPVPLLVSLAGASPGAAAEALLLKAAELEDLPENRAALRLLVRRRLVVPCFDGFDEMATRVDATDLSGRLSELLETAQGEGKVVVSSRDNYFPTDAHQRTAMDTALTRALGASSGLVRLTIQPLTDAQVRVLVGNVRKEGAQEALDHIARIYDLRDLVHRPLLLGMVLGTLERLDPAAKVGRADLYEAYLGRWLDQTRSVEAECFTDEQKKEFAEALAEQLWRSGAGSCTWQELQLSVHARLHKHMPADMPLGAAFLEIQGGAFFVHEGEDRYRFAHKSFLEYFLARALMATLPERPAEALTTKPITAEVANFVGEILRREGEPREAGAVRAVQAWLTGGRGTVETSAREPEGTAVAAANALRLLLGLSRWAGDKGAWVPDAADLRKVNLTREDLSGASLVMADLSGADLAGANLSEVDLTAARLEGASLRGSLLKSAVLTGIRAHGADFTCAEADNARLEDADLTGAVLRQSVWTACLWDRVRMDGADITAWVATSLNKEHIASNRPSQVFDVVRTRLHRALTAVAWHPDGKRLASAGLDGTVRIWDTTNYNQIARVEGHDGPVMAVAWSSDGKRFATTAGDGTVRLWNAATYEEIARLQGHKRVVTAAGWHPNGECLASGGEDGTVRLWDATKHSELARLDCHPRMVNAVAWHPEGKHIVGVGDSGMVKIWNTVTYKEIAHLKGHSGGVYSAKWHPSGKYLATAGDDSTVRVWDTATYKEIACLKGPQEVFMAVAWHPDGKRIIAGGFKRYNDRKQGNGTVHIWHVASRKSTAEFQGNLDGLVIVDWHPKGEQFVTAGRDGVVQFWDATTNREVWSLAWKQADDVRLSMRRPEPGSRTRLYLPLAGFRLAVYPHYLFLGVTTDIGTLPELAKLGFDNVDPWDGEEHFVPPVLPLPGTSARAALYPAAPTPPTENPFRPGPALTNALSLPGRDPILSELLALIDSRSPAVLRGPRRSGKTSILYHLKTRLSPTRPVRHRTLEGRADPLRTADDLARFLDPTLRSDPAPAETLRHQLSSQPGTVLLLDEIANLGDADASVFAWLRAVGQETTSVVLAGSPYDWVLVVERARRLPGSSFGNDVTPVTLGPLAADDAIRFLVETAPPDVPLAADTTARWIVERCGPWPFYLQVMGFAVVQAVRAGQRRALVEPDGVSDLYEQRLLLDRDIAAFGGRWAELPERAQRVLRGLRTRGADLPRYRDLPPDDRRALRDTGLCNALGHWLPDAPFYDWIRRIGDIDEGKVG